LQVARARDGSVSVGGRAIAGECLERLEAARVVEATMPGSDLFLFAERSLIHHVLLLAARDAVLPDMIVAQDAEPAPPDDQAPRDHPGRLATPSRPRLASIGHA
jgi:hypothetical protein